MMVEFNAVVERYSKNGEKTGWHFLVVPLAISDKLKPATRTSYRIKGKLNSLNIKQLALIPIGEGDFILPLNAEMRKKMNIDIGQKVAVSICEDTDIHLLSSEMLETLELDPDSYDFFKTLSQGHQRYFSNWIESAKTIETKTKRLHQMIVGLSQKMGYGEMIRFFKNK